MRVAVVVPALNEANTIKGVVEMATPIATPVVVDDGSTDGTGRLAADAGADVIVHGRPLGYDNALRSGFERALADRFDVVATMDADGQHPASVLEQLVAPIVRGEVGLVLGIRPSGARSSERLFNSYTRIRFGVPDILCGMKAYSADLLRGCGASLSKRTIGTGVALCALRRGAPWAGVSVGITPRPGKSRFGGGLTPNLRILYALELALLADFATRFNRA